MNEAVSSLLPELVLLMSAVVGLLGGSFLPRRRQGFVRAGAVVVCVGAGVLAVIGLNQPDELVFGGSFAVDTGLGVVRLVVLAAVALTLLLAGDQIAGDRRETEVVVLVAGFLLTSLPLYALTGYRHDRRGVEAALKQYLLGALAGVLMLVGVVVLLGAGGGTDYATLAVGLPAAEPITVVLGVVAVLAGLAFELGAVPLHFWVPDVTQAATTPVAAFTSTVPKLGAAMALFRLLDGPLAETSQAWWLLVALVAAVSMTLGNLAAFAQDDVRRLLGWSTVSQVGYLLMAVAVAGRSGQALGALGLYLAAYAVTNLGAFAVVAAVPGARTLADFRGLARAHPWLGVSLVVCLLGLVGTPPTAVFAGKLAVFSAAGDGGLGWLVVVAAVNTVVSLFYYLRWIAPVVRGSGRDGREFDAAVVPWARAAAVLAAGASVAAGVAAGPLLGVASGVLVR
ncbi:MAG: proton-conducting transporter membrane subunit [Mycobacteriaceae bacterium]